MRTYQDTDVDVHFQMSCNVCGNYYWRKSYTPFVCDNCKDLKQQQILEYQRKNNGRKYELAPESIERANNIFTVLVDYADVGIKPQDLKRECMKRGYIGKNISDIHVTLERSNVLTWLDDDGLLHPYKNLNTGERYE